MRLLGMRLPRLWLLGVRPLLLLLHLLLPVNVVVGVRRLRNGGCSPKFDARLRGRDRTSMAHATKDPRVFRSSALRRIDDELTALQGDPGQPARQDPHVVTVVDSERPQVDVPRFETLWRQRR